MNSIQIIDNYQNKGILQMLWSGNITETMIRASFGELKHTLRSQGSPVNLVITVAKSTRIEPNVQLTTLPHLDPHNLRGWMVVGDNRHANQQVTAIVNTLMTRTYDPIAQ